MSIDLRVIRDRVRLRLNDTDARLPTYNVVQVDQAIAHSYLTLQSRLPYAEIYSAAAFTISAGADTFQLPATVTQWTGNDGGAEYGGDVRIQLASNGQFLQKMTVEELDAFRNGSPSVVLAIPYGFALWEEKDQDVQGRCWPGAKDAQVCNLFTALSADDLRDFVGSGTDDMDDVEVQFSRIAAAALESYTASDLLARMTPKAAELRGIDKGVAPMWRQEAEGLLYEEAARHHDLQNVGRTQRWVP